MLDNTRARTTAIRDSLYRKPHAINIPKNDLGRILPVTSYFGSYSIDIHAIQKSLDASEGKKLSELLQRGDSLEDSPLAEKIASVLRSWAIERGATHFCHWFQPMTGSVAEKHDALLSFDKNSKPLEKLLGSQLIQSEPDASSFPSGGVHTTAKARGYTAWDLSSPIFLMENTNGRTVYIPAVFISYRGPALDEKIPMIRALQVMNTVATKTQSLLGNKDVKQVHTTLGLEQEYFLIDDGLASLRPDIKLTGRTLIGAPPAKGQELEDHYFSSIPPRVQSFMEEVEFELYRLGIPAKTRHSEVAPCQFELATIFERGSVSVDHNYVIMKILEKVAKRHHLFLLLHEKPFEGLNGSGKHNNWSMVTDTGENLLKPGETTQERMRFLVMLGAVLKAIHKHNGLLGASIASLGNDKRLGAHEAPPAIMSVFLGDELTKTLKEIKAGKEMTSPHKSIIDLGLPLIAKIKKDNTDRNRTSPFAFTGDKFEFRAVGSSASCNWSMTCLSAAVAESLSEINDKLESRYVDAPDKQKVLLEIIKEALLEAEPICFEGNNYSQEWLVQAEKQGLKHLKNTAHAMEAYSYPETKNLFEKFKILSEQEQQSRLLVRCETYEKKAYIEAKTMLMLVDQFVFPVSSQYMGDLAKTVQNTKSIPKAITAPQEDTIRKLSNLISQLLKARNTLETEMNAIDREGEANKTIIALTQSVLPAIEEVRTAADQLESLVGDPYWILPKYYEMLDLS